MQTIRINQSSIQINSMQIKPTINGIKTFNHHRRGDVPVIININIEGIITRMKCPECKSTKIINTLKEDYCSKCGLVLTTYYEYTGGVRVEYPLGFKR